MVLTLQQPVRPLTPSPCSSDVGLGSSMSAASPSPTGLQQRTVSISFSSCLLCVPALELVRLCWLYGSTQLAFPSRPVFSLCPP